MHRIKRKFPYIEQDRYQIRINKISNNNNERNDSQGIVYPLLLQIVKYILRNLMFLNSPLHFTFSANMYCNLFFVQTHL